MELQPLLHVKHRESGESTTYTMEQEVFVIGRDPSSSIVLEAKRISRQHAEVSFENDHFFVQDLGSGNGTHLNNQRLEPHEKVLLRTNDLIRIENFDIRFQMPGEEVPDFSETTNSDILEVKMIKKLLRTIDKENVPILEVVAGTATGQRFVFEGKNQEVIIGRDASCQFHIDDEVISRQHARIIKKWDTVTIVDLDSKNGIYVNDERVQEKVLSNGDRILLGTLALIFRNPSEQAQDFVAAKPPPETAPSPETAVDPESPGPESPSDEAKSTLPSVSPGAEIRISRRANLGTARGGKKPQADSLHQEAAAEAQAIPQAAPTKPPEPSPSTAASPPPAEADNQLAEDTEVPLPIWQRFTTTEIAGAILGLIILLGSIWILLKLL